LIKKKLPSIEVREGLQQNLEEGITGPKRKKGAARKYSLGPGGVNISELSGKKGEDRKKRP